MPTEPLKSILYRDFAIVVATDVIDVASPLLQELVNHATNALVRCAPSLAKGVDEDIAPIALYRHMIEMTDGIEVLVTKACAVPAIPTLRSLFEALLALEYIVEDDSMYANRSLSWLVSYTHQRIDTYQRLDPQSAKGVEFKRLFEDDKELSKMPLPDPLEANAAEENLMSFLNRPHIQPIEAEFSSHGRRPNWYRLFGGPGNLRELAKHLRRGAQYEFLYRRWSRTSHSEDLLPFLHITDQGKPAIGHLREKSPLRQVALYAASLMLSGTRLTIGKFRPGEDLARWYNREIKSKYSKLRHFSAHN